MSKLYNLARMSTPTTGTGTLTLGSAASGFLSFASAGVQDGETITYAIEDGTNREIGRGVYTAAGATLTRSVLRSTNANAAISLSGSAQVFITAAAEDFMEAGGTTGQLQFNSSGYLAGMAGSSWDNTNRVLTLNGLTLIPTSNNLQLGAAAAAAPVAQTLQVQSVAAGTTNTAGANFTIKGSASTGNAQGGSIVFQLALGGTSGSAQNAYSDFMTLSAVNGLTLGTASINNTNAFTIFRVNTSTPVFFITTTWQSARYALGIQNNGSGNPDVLLYPDAVNTLGLRNGTNAQRFRVYNTYTDASNGEWFSIDWQTTANIALVGPVKNGTGAQRVQRLQYLEDGGSGSTTPSLGTSCPAANGTVKSWIKVLTSDGTTAYIPCWA